jgi:hypothetical protein
MNAIGLILLGRTHGRLADKAVVPSGSAALVVARGAFVSPLVPHSTEHRACVETDPIADEEGDQRDHNAGGP